MKNAKDILTIPGIHYFNGWDNLQKYLETIGNPPYRIQDGLDLQDTPITSLGNLESVGGYLNLHLTKITSLGKLKSVGGYLDLNNTPISKKYTEKEIRKIANIIGSVYL